MTASPSTPEQTTSVYVYDTTHGWVLVCDDFPSKQEAERFAALITDFEQFAVSVAPINVMVTTDDSTTATSYEDVYYELETELKGGITHALNNYVSVAQETNKIEAL